MILHFIFHVGTSAVVRLGVEDAGMILFILAITDLGPLLRYTVGL